MDPLAAFAWCWILLGLLSGVAMGLLFHRDDWLGGYGSWPRRMVRLGHISFFGTGMLCLLAALTRSQWPGVGGGEWLVVGALTMPAVCFASAAWKPARHLFFVPVLGLIAGTAAAAWSGVSYGG